jgi:hypothetical protein
MEEQMAAEIWLNTNLVRLQKALLCANCDVISEGLNGHCAGCGSESLLSLRTILGEMNEPERSSDLATSQAVNDVGVRSLSAAA